MKRPINQDNYPKSNVSTLDQTETQCPVRYVCSAFQDFLIQFLIETPSLLSQLHTCHENGFRTLMVKPKNVFRKHSTGLNKSNQPFSDYYPIQNLQATTRREEKTIRVTVD